MGTNTKESSFFLSKMMADWEGEGVVTSLCVCCNGVFSFVVNRGAETRRVVIFCASVIRAWSMFALALSGPLTQSSS